VLVPAKLWSGRRGDAWLRRTTMMVIGVLIGGFALWVQGWAPPLSVNAAPTDAAAGAALTGLELHGSGFSELAGYLCYFALAFFALRWWKLADRRRSRWFSFAPVLAAGFWGLILLAIPPHAEMVHGLLALVMASVIVQLVSPWDEPAPRCARKVRLRYA